MDIEEKRTEVVNETNDDKAVSYFTNLPIGQLIASPFSEVAKGQAALCEMYVQTLFQFAFENPKQSGFDKDNTTRVLKFAYTHPVVDEVNGTVTSKDFVINVPLLALVPIPAFTMDSADVKFDMEVNIANTESNENAEEIYTDLNLSFWKVSANLSGKVSNTSKSSYTNTQKATYSISAHAAQQAPAEGMTKLTSLLAEAMEPIEMTK